MTTPNGAPALEARSTIAARTLIGRIAGASMRREELLLGLLGVGLLVAAWQALALSGTINPLLFASPTASAITFANLFTTGEIYPHLLASGWLFATGLTLAVVAGTILGFAAGWFPTVRGILLPHVALLYSTPSIALMPVFIVYFGLGFGSQFAVVFLLPFFPAYYAAFDAVTHADPNLIKVARSYTASDVYVFRSIVLPQSIPLLISGLRIALGKAITGVIVVELYASTVGVGYFLNISALRFRTDIVFAVLALLAVFGLLGSIGLRALEGRFDKWRPQTGIS